MVEERRVPAIVDEAKPHQTCGPGFIREPGFLIEIAQVRDFNVLGVAEAGVLYDSQVGAVTGRQLKRRRRMASDATQIAAGLRVNDKVLIASATGARIRSGELDGQGPVEVLVRVGLENDAVDVIPIGNHVCVGQNGSAKQTVEGRIEGEKACSVATPVKRFQSP